MFFSLEKLDTSRTSDANLIRCFKNMYYNCITMFSMFRQKSKATGPNVAATHLRLARAEATPSSAI